MSSAPKVHWLPPSEGLWPPIRVFGQAMLRLMAPAFGFRVDGREHLPRSGGVLLVTNHLADVDPPFLATAVLPRQLLYVADAKHFTSRPQSVLLFSLGAFPIRLDEVDTRALRYARTMLERGEVVSIFPEGRATFGDRMLPFLEGMGYLALTPGATVLPAGIWGTQRILDGKRPRGWGPVRVRFGPPVAVPSEGARRDRARQVTADARDAVAGLLRSLVEEDRP